MIVEYKGRRFCFNDTHNTSDGVWFCNTIEQCIGALFPNIAWKFFETRPDDDGNYNFSIAGYDGKYLLKHFTLSVNEDPWYVDDEENAIEKLETMEDLIIFDTKKDLLKYSKEHELNIGRNVR